jgi:F-type H+-transporting ATPase subunit gamma
MSFSQLKGRIKTVKNTSKITKAMSLISAAQTNKIKHVLQSYKAYYKLIGEIAGTIVLKARSRFDQSIKEVAVDDNLVIESCQKYLGLDNLYITQQRKLLVVISSEKGLCGSFNSSIVSHTLSIVDDNTDVFCVGKKGYELLVKNRKKQVKIVTKNNYIELQSKQINAQIVMDKLSIPLMHLLASNLYSQVEVVYTEFITMLKQEVITMKLFPLIVDNYNTDEIKVDSNPMIMLDHIIPQYINSRIYHAVLHSIKSETVKRMITMENANKNSQDMLKNLTLKYNRARQTKVTMELIEVISGML